MSDLIERLNRWRNSTMEAGKLCGEAADALTEAYQVEHAFSEQVQLLDAKCAEYEARGVYAELFRNPPDDVLHEMGSAVFQEVRDKAPAPDLGVLNERYRMAWARVLAKLATHHSPDVHQLVNAEVPEGCTPADAAMLRKANHGLADENTALRGALQELVRQIKAFTEEHGEADFYTGDAVKLLAEDVPTESLPARGVPRTCSQCGVVIVNDIGEWTDGKGRYWHGDCKRRSESPAVNSSEPKA